MTFMACPEEMETERDFVGVLEQARSWKIFGDRLELFDGGGGFLARFQASVPKSRERQKPSAAETRDPSVQCGAFGSPNAPLDRPRAILAFAVLNDLPLLVQLANCSRNRAVV